MIVVEKWNIKPGRMLLISHHQYFFEPQITIFQQINCLWQVSCFFVSAQTLYRLGVIDEIQYCAYLGKSWHNLGYQYLGFGGVDVIALFYSNFEFAFVNSKLFTCPFLDNRNLQIINLPFA